MQDPYGKQKLPLGEKEVQCRMRQCATCVIDSISTHLSRRSYAWRRYCWSRRRSTLSRPRWCCWPSTGTWPPCHWASAAVPRTPQRGPPSCSPLQPWAQWARNERCNSNRDPIGDRGGELGIGESWWGGIGQVYVNPGYWCGDMVQASTICN